MRSKDKSTFIMKSIYQQLTLKTRITVSFVLLMVGVMTFVIAAELLDYDELRAYAMSESLRDEAPHLDEDIAKRRLPTLPEGSELYDAQNVPDILRPYAPGYHRTEKPDDRNLLVFERNNARYYLLQERDRYLYLEFMIDSFAPLIIFLCLVFAFWIGRLTSARVTAPIVQLSDAVQRNQKPLPFLNANDEIGVLARAFARHSEELEKFLERERCFVGDASHELRTPLAIISGAAENLVYQLPMESHLKTAAERILRTTQEMQRQLTCLLLLSRDPQTLTKTDVPLRPLIEECISRCQPWLAKKPVVLTLDIPLRAHTFAHGDLVRSVIWNLLRNACQYTTEGEILLSLRDKTLIISDTGPGLPSGINPQYFHRFQQGGERGGEGLGLSIVQRIVDYLGWHMNVQTSEKGCCFTLVMHCQVDMGS